MHPFQSRQDDFDEAHPTGAEEYIFFYFTRYFTLDAPHVNEAHRGAVMGWEIPELFCAFNQTRICYFSYITHFVIKEYKLGVIFLTFVFHFSVKSL